MIRAGRGSTEHRHTRRAAIAAASVFVLGAAAALTMLHVNGTAYAADTCAEPDHVGQCSFASDSGGGYDTVYPGDGSGTFDGGGPSSGGSWQTVTETETVIRTETVTQTDMVTQTETVTQTESATVTEPVTETQTVTQLSEVLAPTTETVTTAVPADPARADHGTVTIPVLTTAFADVIRAVTLSPEVADPMTVTDRAIVTQAGETWWAAASINPQTGQRPAVSLSATEVYPGQTLTVKGAGGTPGEQVLLVLHSDPVQLGAATVDDGGRFQTSVVIPVNTDIGQHTLEVVGVGCGVTTSVPLTVVAPPAFDVAAVQDISPFVDREGSPMSLSYTGVDTTQTLMLGCGLLGAGAVVSLLSRRRPASGRHRF